MPDMEVPGPPSDPPSRVFLPGYPYEVRLWREGTLGHDGQFKQAGWESAAWCSAKGYAEMFVESALVRYGCRYGQVLGPSLEDPAKQVTWLRYDHPPDEDEDEDA